MKFPRRIACLSASPQYRRFCISSSTKVTWPAPVKVSFAASSVLKPFAWRVRSLSSCPTIQKTWRFLR